MRRCLMFQEELYMSSLIQSQMAEVERRDSGEIRGWWTMSYWRRKLSYRLSTITLLQLLSSPIPRKVFSCQLLRQIASFMKETFGCDGNITKHMDQCKAGLH